jgi:hypothetical protein
VGQLAVTAVGLPPLLEQGQDLIHLVLQQPVHRRPAGRRVGQPAADAAVQPAVRAPLRQLQRPARIAQRPVGRQCLVQQLQQLVLGGRIDPAGDPAT